MKKTAFYLVTCLVALGCNDKPVPAAGGGANVIVYPNPTSFGASVEVRNANGRPFTEPYTLLVFDPEGQMILRHSASPGETRHSLPLLNAPRGNYQVVVDAPAGITRRKLVKL